MTNLNEHLQSGTTAMEFFANAIKKLNLQNCTAFEVYAHTAAIPAGLDPVLGDISVELPANMMTHKFKLRSSVPDTTKSDVIVDWGDGKISSIAKGEFDSKTDPDADKESDITVSHTYEADGKYVVRIFGVNYFGIKHDPADSTHNLICRVFDWDLPIANHILNLSNFCPGAYQLVNVHIASYKFLEQTHNHYGIFENCVNLKSCTGIGEHFPPTRSVGRFFKGCSNLIETDFKFPVIFTGTSNAIIETFRGCSKLAVAIESLFHSSKFNSRALNVTNLFRDCAALTGTIPANKLWGDGAVGWSNTGAVFTGCSEAILAQAPTTWGGTKEASTIDNGEEEKA